MSTMTSIQDRSDGMIAGTPSTSNGNQHVTLPPISSFDSLIRAAENQYPQDPSVLSYQLSTVPRIVAQGPPGNSSTTKAGPGTSSVTPALSPGSSGSLSPTTASSLEASISPVIQGSQARTGPAKIHKPRKKKECPICHNFYANLSTHRSTHLTPENRPHKCPICQRGFARNNDLIRHKKRHWKDEIVEISSHSNSSSLTSSDSSDSLENSTIPHHHLDERDQLRSLHQIKGTFKCPFNSSLIQLDMEIYPYKSKPLGFETSNYHQTGVFSRCDTFKNHLKALHFEYPPGTKKRDRSVVPGRCKHCGLRFSNVDLWLNEHIGKTCGYTYH
ncbi:hypothetical protein ZYGR_0AG03100 [Zygosaccharomyces rouxii]|uniref:C2H2-type domain-containing protein n=1 Tax=Zygosaccharomyces rouxii TaxID=4956 RepID=A0A1Q3A988_ZYGRO|nr:hypothetical protein ZYGR_0AG03100 [Zygosaccharomyces rouxii]